MKRRRTERCVECFATGHRRNTCPRLMHGQEPSRCDVIGCGKEADSVVDVDSATHRVCPAHRIRARNYGTLDPTTNTVECGRCGKPGHNSQSCKAEGPKKVVLIGKEDLTELPEKWRPTYHPGQRECLRCSARFASWCVRRNRLCNRCQMARNDGSGMEDVSL